MLTVASFHKGKLTEVITASVSDDTGTSYDDSIPETRLNFEFDLMGRTVKSSQTVDSDVYNLSYKYNLGGQMTQETYPSGRVVNLGYDDASRLSNVNGGQGHVYADAFTYAGHGAISSFTMGNGATVSLGYGTNGRLQLSDLTLAKNGAILQKYVYTYGQIASGSVDTTKNNGQLAQVESWIGTEQQYQQQFSYDTLGRLTESIEKYGTGLGSTAYDVKYKYDVFGNRQQRQADNAGNTAIVQKWVEAGDIRVSDNRYSSGVTYDDAGNITADPRFRNMIYGYDANGRQNYAAEASGSGPVTAVFDGAGQRVANKAGGVLTIMVYDAAGKLVAEYGATAPTTANLQYVTADYQGSTRVVTNSSGAVANRRDYLPFGEEIGATVGSRTPGKGFGSGDMVRQKYAGMESDDATGMAHTLWRKQDNFSGRWTSPDPYGGSMTIADPQSFNRYTYVNNDPTNQVDPLGLISGADASQSWGDVSGTFWGESFDFNGTHFGGPEAHVEAIRKNSGDLNTRLAELRVIQSFNDGEDDGDTVRVYAFAFMTRDEALKYYRKLYGGNPGYSYTPTNPNGNVYRPTYRGPDVAYNKVTIGIGPFSLSVAVDKYSRVYISPGYTISAPRASVSFTEGEVLNSYGFSTDRADDIDSVLSGGSVDYSAGVGIVGGGSYSANPLLLPIPTSDLKTRENGLGTPQIGIGRSYGIRAGQVYQWILPLRQAFGHL